MRCLRPHPAAHRPALAAAAAAASLIAALASGLPAQAAAERPAGTPVPTHPVEAGEKPAPTAQELAGACERAVLQALPAAQRAEASFTTAPSVQPRLSDATQSVLRGAGRVRAAGGARTFTYSCNVDLANAEAIGVVLRQSGPSGGDTPARAAIDPDMSRISPQACESKAAEALKKRWPSVSQISFDSGTRQLQQDAADRAELRGQGHALPTPNSPSTFFGFDCTIDPRDGRVLSARISG